jgi:hypothetical protein
MALLSRGVGLVAAALLLAPLALAQPAPPPSEYEVKAAFLFHFAKFVEWPPADLHDDFVIGILGRDPFGDALDRVLAGKTFGPHRIVVRRAATLEELGDVRELFISNSEKANLTEILKQLQGRPTLTVGEVDDFVSRGGMVGFRLQGGVVRFDINLQPVARAGLKMSSQLIRVARRVMTSSGGL